MPDSAHCLVLLTVTAPLFQHLALNIDKKKKLTLESGESHLRSGVTMKGRTDVLIRNSSWLLTLLKSETS